MFVLLIIRFVCLGEFALIETKAIFPLLPRSDFTGQLAWGAWVFAAGRSSFGIIIYYFYQFMEVIKGDSPLLATAKWSGAAASCAVAGLGDWISWSFASKRHHVLHNGIFHSRSLNICHSARRPNLLGASICSELNHLIGNVSLLMSTSSLYLDLYNFGWSFHFQGQVLSFKHHYT